jgi:hypothetical protein
LCEEKELLAEELGHYYHNALYNANTDKIVIEQKEYRANKWKNTTLMTINNFKEAFKKGINNVYDIADYFNLSTNTVEFAYNYYKENGYL